MIAMMVPTLKKDGTVVKFDNGRNRKIIQKYETVKLYVKIQNLK